MSSYCGRNKKLAGAAAHLLEVLAALAAPDSGATTTTAAALSAKSEALRVGSTSRSPECYTCTSTRVRERGFMLNVMKTLSSKILPTQPSFAVHDDLTVHDAYLVREKRRV